MNKQVEHRSGMQKINTKSYVVLNSKSVCNEISELGLTKHCLVNNSELFLHFNSCFL